jgi:transposase InsO family protein
MVLPGIIGEGSTMMESLTRFSGHLIVGYGGVRDGKQDYFKSQAEAKMGIFEWVESWYNPHRRHSSLGYRLPVAYERSHAYRLAA